MRKHNTHRRQRENESIWEKDKTQEERKALVGWKENNNKNNNNSNNNNRTTVTRKNKRHTHVHIKKG